MSNWRCQTKTYKLSDIGWYAQPLMLLVLMPLVLLLLVLVPLVFVLLPDEFFGPNFWGKAEV